MSHLALDPLVFWRILVLLFVVVGGCLVPLVVLSLSPAPFWENDEISRALRHSTVRVLRTQLRHTSQLDEEHRSRVGCGLHHGFTLGIERREDLCGATAVLHNLTNVAGALVCLLV